MLKENIETDLKESLKGKKEAEILTLRQLLAVILNKEKEKRYRIAKAESRLTEKELVKKSQLTDEEIIEVISSETKKRKEAILEFDKGGRQDLVEKETKEMKILQKYLPEQLSEEELKKIVQEAIKKVEAKEIHPVKSAEGGVSPEAKQFNRVKDIGRVMAEVMPQVKGKADGGEINRIVKELLLFNAE